MFGSVLGAFLLLAATVLLAGDVLTAVLVAGLVIAASVFVLRVAVHVRRHQRQSSSRRTIGDAAPRPGFLVLWPPVSADVGGRPTPLASADSGRGKAAA